MRYLIARRVTQLTIIGLYILAHVWGVKVLEGNLSFSTFLSTVPLSDPFAVLQMFAAGAAISLDILVGALIIVTVYGVIGGRMFCSWVCPINMVTDAANWLRRKLGISRVQRRLYLQRYVRFWVLGLSLVLSFVMGLTAFELISPISILHRGLIFGMGFGLTVVLVIFLFDLLVHENAWCGYICPLGGFYALLGKFSWIRVKYDNDKCTECLKCKTVCPEKEVLEMVTKFSATVTGGACTNCARFIEVCEDDALNFGVRKYIKEQK